MSNSRSMQRFNDALKEAFLKYSFSFTWDGEDYSAWYDTEAHEICSDFECEELLDLTDCLEKIIQQSALRQGLDTQQLRKFLRKHLRAMIEVQEELWSII